MRVIDLEKFRKAGARIARTGGTEWTPRRVIHWALSQGAWPEEAAECVRGFAAERKLAAEQGDRIGKRLGK